MLVSGSDSDLNESSDIRLMSEDPHPAPDVLVWSYYISLLLTPAELEGEDANPIQGLTLSKIMFIRNMVTLKLGLKCHSPLATYNVHRLPSHGSTPSWQASGLKQSGLVHLSCKTRKLAYQSHVGLSFHCGKTGSHQTLSPSYCQTGGTRGNADGKRNKSTTLFREIRSYFPIVDSPVTNCRIVETRNILDYDGGRRKSKWSHFLSKVTRLTQGHRFLLCQLDGGSSGKGPGRLFLHISRNLLLVLIAQEEERETHGGEVKLLQEPGRFCTVGRKLHLSQQIQLMCGKRSQQHTQPKTTKNAKDSLCHYLEMDVEIINN